MNGNEVTFAAHDVHDVMAEADGFHTPQVRFESCGVCCKKCNEMGPTKTYNKNEVTFAMGIHILLVEDAC